MFLAGRASHPYSKRILKLLENKKSDNKDLNGSSPSSTSGSKALRFPILVIVSPFPSVLPGSVEGSGTNSKPSNINNSNYGMENLEWVATVGLERVDLTPQKIMSYLDRVLEVHKAHFSSTVEVLEESPEEDTHVTEHSPEEDAVDKPKVDDDLESYHS